MANELPKRNEVKSENTWNLSDMFESKKAWEKSLEDIKAESEKIVALEGKVGESGANLLAALNSFALMDEKISIAYNYASRLYDEDTTNTAHQAMEAKAMSLYSDVYSKCAFLDPEIIAISDETLEKYYSEVPELELYRKYIEEVQRVKEHLLSAEMEKLVALTSEMSRVSSDSFSNSINVG